MSKLALALVNKRPADIDDLPVHHLPHYTILAAVYREAPVIAQLVQALSRLDYPRDRLQAILILEQDDEETLGALAWLDMPSFIEVQVKLPGGPKTKPNALNAALPFARGEFIVVYDAEDIPAPDQLKEAAARFHQDTTLACLQAPLRICNADEGFLTRQFAVEYAGQFEAILPGLAGLGSGFPLGGTSNHIRLDALHAVGGWDAYNVTEDADLGFRLASGYRMGVICAPTWEDAPDRFRTWLAQRTRWIKGYMQTWGVQMRRPFAAGVRGFLAIQATLGAAILGAALHGPLVVILLLTLGVDAFTRSASPQLVIDLLVLSGGWAGAVLANAVGARRAGLPMRFVDALLSLAYWPLQSTAFVLAVRQLVLSPYHWNKTPHRPCADMEIAASVQPLDAAVARSVSRAA